MLARIGVAGLILLVGPAWYAVRGDLRELRAQLPRVAAFGALAVAGAQAGFFNAVARMPIGVALLFDYLGIVLVVAWVWLRSGRRPGATTILGIVLALGGLVLVLDGGRRSPRRRCGRRMGALRGRPAWLRTTSTEPARPAGCLP